MVYSKTMDAVEQSERMLETVSGNLYKIGAVSKRTGITPECLRAWERRYGLAPAERAGKTRFYSAEQVEWLLAIKALLDQGHPISQVIRFDAEEIGRRLRPAAGASRQPAGQTARLGVVGAELIEALRDARGSGATLLGAAEWADIDELAADEDPPANLDCVLLHLASLDVQRLDAVREVYGSAPLVVAYSHARADDAERFEAIGCALLKWPSPWQDVERAVDEALRGPLYNARQLMTIGENADRACCECPQVLVGFIRDLDKYAEHSGRCDGDRGDDHAMIEEGVQNARTQLERSLRPLVEKYELLGETNGPLPN